MTKLPSDLRRAAKFHGHVCPGLVIGYRAAKAALESHCRQLALELVRDGITVNAIRAGVTDTRASRAIRGHEELFEYARQRNPGGRLTRPEDVAEAIVALASPRLYWMTGNTIGVDGGELMGSKRAED